jgi:hypothetical protein
MTGHIQQRGTSMAKRSHGDGGIDQGSNGDCEFGG